MDKQDWMNVRNQIVEYREECRSIGICTAIILTTGFQKDKNKQMFDVLEKHKPDILHNLHWWPTANPEGVEIRLSIIDTIIAELEESDSEQAGV